MSLFGKSDAELEELSQKIEKEDLTEDERKSLFPEPLDTTKDELIVEVDEDPKSDKDKTVAPSPDAPKDTPKPTDAGTPTPEPPKPFYTDEQYQAIVTKHPQLAKFKNDAEFVDNLAKSYVSLETKLGQPKPVEPPPSPTSEQKLAEVNKRAMTETEKRLLSDPEVLDALTIKDADNKVVEILSLPRTEAEMSKFRREYPAEFMMIKNRGERVYDATFRELLTEAKTEDETPKVNMDTVESFVASTGDYYKKIAPKATQEDMKIVGDKLQEFVAKALPDGKYYTKVGKAFRLNSSQLFADFLTENAELTTKLAEINAKNSITPNVGDAVKQAQLKTSMKSLANAGLNGGERKKINLADPRQIGQLSDAQLDRLEKELLNK